MNSFAVTVLIIASANCFVGYALALLVGWRPAIRQKALLLARQRAAARLAAQRAELARSAESDQEPTSCEPPLPLAVENDCAASNSVHNPALEHENTDPQPADTAVTQTDSPSDSLAERATEPHVEPLAECNVEPFVSESTKEAAENESLGLPMKSDTAPEWVAAGNAPVAEIEPVVADTSSRVSLPDSLPLDSSSDNIICPRPPLRFTALDPTGIDAAREESELPTEFPLDESCVRDAVALALVCDTQGGDDDNRPRQTEGMAGVEFRGPQSRPLTALPRRAANRLSLNLAAATPARKLQSDLLSLERSIDQLQDQLNQLSGGTTDDFGDIAGDVCVHAATYLERLDGLTRELVKGPGPRAAPSLAKLVDRLQQIAEFVPALSLDEDELVINVVRLTAQLTNLRDATGVVVRDCASVIADEATIPN